MFDDRVYAVCGACMTLRVDARSHLDPGVSEEHIAQNAKVMPGPIVLLGGTEAAGADVTSVYAPMGRLNATWANRTPGKTEAGHR